ncbi:hypothetical protein D6783_01290, partial [Candidatus Woesearchaeota archaeon]
MTRQRTNKKPRIAIIGGGFAGITFLTTLYNHARKQPPLQCTLYDPSPEFSFTPLLVGAAAGSRAITDACIPFKDLAKALGFTYTQARATRLDPNTNHVTVKHPTGTITKEQHDYFILTTGAETQFYQTPGAKQHTLSLRSAKDAKNIHQALTHQKKAKQPGVIIIGAGPTGVELAGDISVFYQQNNLPTHITLISHAPTILPRFNQKIQQSTQKTLQKRNITILTNTTVTKCKKSAVTIQEGQKQEKTLTSPLLIWAGGCKPVTIPLRTQNNVTERGRYIVTPTLQLKGHQNIFAFGDNAQIEGEQPLPLLAQVAEQEGTHAAKNILRLLNNKRPKPFTFHDKGRMVSLGPKKASITINTPAGTIHFNN